LDDRLAELAHRAHGALFRIGFEGPPAIAPLRADEPDADPPRAVVRVWPEGWLRDPADERLQEGEIETQVRGDAAAVDRMLELDRLRDGTLRAHQVTAVTVEAERFQLGLDLIFECEGDRAARHPASGRP